jgi:hypothetical protein
MMKHPIWRAQRWMLDLLNPPSQTWRGRRNDRKRTRGNLLMGGYVLVKEMSTTERKP